MVSPRSVEGWRSLEVSGSVCWAIAGVPGNRIQAAKAASRLRCGCFACGFNACSVDAFGGLELAAVLPPMSEAHADGRRDLSWTSDVQAAGVENAAIVIAVEQILADQAKEIGRASCRERVCQSV